MLFIAPVVLLIPAPLLLSSLASTLSSRDTDVLVHFCCCCWTSPCYPFHRLPSASVRLFPHLHHDHSLLLVYLRPALLCHLPLVIFSLVLLFLLWFFMLMLWPWWWASMLIVACVCACCHSFHSHVMRPLAWMATGTARTGSAFLPLACSPSALLQPSRMFSLNVAWIVAISGFVPPCAP